MYLRGSFGAPCSKLHVGISGFDSQILLQDSKKKQSII